MKKVGLLFLIVSLGLIPFNVNAMMRYDENGNEVTVESSENEYHIMLTDEGTDTVAPDEKVEPYVGEDGVDPVVPDETLLDKTVSDKDAIEAPNANIDDSIRDLSEEIYQTTGIVEDALLSETSLNKTKKDNTVFYVVGSGVLGISLGAALVYFFIKRH